eukprot:scaffold4870_cov60-Phaeocystis_antarctica.AAC.3
MVAAERHARSASLTMAARFVATHLGGRSGRHWLGWHDARCHGRGFPTKIVHRKLFPTFGLQAAADRSLDSQEF